MVQTKPLLQPAGAAVSEVITLPVRDRGRLARLEVVHDDDAVGDLVDELAVVADDDEGAGELFEGLLEGLNGFHVEVTRRLVEDEGVGFGQHHHREAAADALTTREDADGLLDVVATKQHTAEHGPDGVDVLVLGVLTNPIVDG